MPLDVLSHAMLDAVRWAPLLYLLAVPLWPRTVPLATRWWLAELLSASVLGLWLLALLPALQLLATGDRSPDMPGVLMALLIAMLGWVIVRYSRRYLAGEPGQLRYVGALMFTLAAVSTVAVSTNLAVMAAAWIASSLGLHRLLTFYPQRTAALVAAHKKFIASRCADLCVLAALVLLYRAAGTLSLEALNVLLRAPGAMGLEAQAAMLLIAFAVILKSAQLPVHGWILQVMEAPTPVSALLHAGVVNLGGFVLIRLAGPLSQAPGAQTLLVLVGGGTALLAGLVMLTRISIKLRLAWSTCAQMGFMVMECGLGLYELALLHLVAHSLYKAHAFLTAGETVTETRTRALLPADSVLSPGLRLFVRALSALLAVGIVFASAALWQRVWPAAQPTALALSLAGLGLAPLLFACESGSLRATLRSIFNVAALAQAYLLWHGLFGSVLSLPVEHVGTALSVYALLAVLLLYLMQSWLQIYPRGRIAQTLYPWAYAGFHVDERFTRLSFRLWPPHIPARASVPGARRNRSTLNLENMHES